MEAPGKIVVDVMAYMNVTTPKGVSRMHPNGVLLKRLFTALDQHQHSTIAACYHPEATFHDIAFDLRGKQRIHGMWHMICDGGDLTATFEIVDANDQEGRVRLVDEYTFRDTGRKVRNVIDSRFRFQNGLIIEHKDFCDAQAWAAMALGGVTGFLAGRIRLLRSWKANKKLNKFARQHSEYR